MSRRKRICDLVKARVDAAGLSNSDIAKRTGWKELRVWRLLTGRTDISAEDMRVFARVIRCDVADLYDSAEQAS